MDISNPRLKQQIDFILEIDKLKHIQRRSWLLNGERRENTAEHSWHVALLALTLAEHGPEDLDATKAMTMMVLHDIVEIDAGDTFVYDTKGYEDKAEREQAAADRIFGLLPADQAQRYRDLWEEFEARESPEAKFATGIDRLMPLMHNYFTGGKTWQEGNVTAAQVRQTNQHIQHGSPQLWAFASTLIDSAVEQGYLAP